jgi:hypothetical protein
MLEVDVEQISYSKVMNWPRETKKLIPTRFA